MEEETILKTYEERRKQAGEFNLTSDLFAGKVFEDREACQELCRILLQDNKIVIKDVKTKYAIRNLENHSVELDIFAEDISGKLINVEIQMYEEKSPFRRVRYYLSSIDMSILEKGKPYNELPDVTLVYISKGDFIGAERGRYKSPRKADEQDVTMSLDNGLQEIYFNLEYYTDDAKINELLEYFKDSKPDYITKNFPRIVERVRYFKVQKEGVNTMCEIADRIRREGEQEGIRKGKQEGIRESIINSLKNLIKNAHMTLEQAMTVLEIPENDKQMYVMELKQ
ncbi:MAG: Rpn family recombination-promoting nuclease/putative transposase [Clostridiales bacterium]|nr:Rpn family recombination-promoting nuclease/putative transposase [Clostridiales bacterium]